MANNNFAINFMQLIIEPELLPTEGNLTNCIEKLDIVAQQDLESTLYTGLVVFVEIINGTNL